MSNTPYETYEDTYGPYVPHARYGGPPAAVPDPRVAAPPYEGGADPYPEGTGQGLYAAPDLQVAADAHAAPGPYPLHDTYRPAYTYSRTAGPGPTPAAPVPVPVPVPETVTGRGAARRAARRRKAEQRPETLRRLVPQALVVAFLAGGTTAFVADDKAIRLNVDGKERTLHTFADDVTELLADEGVDVGAHDVIAPGRTAALTSGDEVAVRYGRPVRLTLDGQSRQVWTTERTVDGALRQLGVRAEGAYVSASRSRRIERHGLDLDVRTERSVTVMADGRRRTIRTNAATVGEAVDAAGVRLHGQDTTSVPAQSFPRDGQTITVMRVTGGKEVREEIVPFATERIDDPALFQGTEVVTQAGESGMRRVTYALRTVNGVKQKPRRLKAEPVRTPRTQMIRVGTRPLPSSVAGADTLNWSSLAACESGGSPAATDTTGTYGGLYQFDTQTWHSLGGAGRPQDAPAAEQTYRAKKLYVRRGTSPWPHCGPRLHG
ncbi:ubiquitin-like domain-containing protein [Streptomyces sp. SGAir0957]